MTDKELDALEARLRRVTEDRETPPSFYLLARLFEDAADAIETLSARVGELEGLVIQYRDDLMHPPSEDSKERRLAAIRAALHDKEKSNEDANRKP